MASPTADQERLRPIKMATNHQLIIARLDQLPLQNGNRRRPTGYKGSMVFSLWIRYLQAYLKPVRLAI